MDCRARACPLYAFLPQAEDDPIKWWQSRKGDWLAASQNARRFIMEEHRESNRQKAEAKSGSFKVKVKRRKKKIRIKVRR